MRYGAEHKKERQRFAHKNLNERVGNYTKITIEMYIIKYTYILHFLPERLHTVISLRECPN